MSSFLIPACLRISSVVPFGRSFLWKGITTRFLSVVLKYIRWLPLVLLRTKPVFVIIFSNFCGVRAGILITLSDSQRVFKRTIISGDFLAAFLQIRNIQCNGFSYHLDAVVYILSIGNATRQRRDGYCVSPLWFLPEQNPIVEQFHTHNYCYICRTVKACTVRLKRFVAYITVRKINLDSPVEPGNDGNGY